MEDNKLPQASVSTQIDFTVNKEDVMTVLMADKEDEMQGLIDAKNVEIASLKTKAKEAKETLINAIKEQLGIEKGDHIDSLINNGNYDYSKSEYIEPILSVKIFGINRLSELKNPKTAKNKSNSRSVYPSTMAEDIRINRDVEIDGFRGTLTKRVTPKLNAAINKLMKARDEAAIALFKAKEEVSQMEFNLLILDTDKSVKAALIKRIVNTSDFKGFLLDMPSK